MLKTDFTMQVERLCNVYGAKHFTEERVSLLWKEFDNLPIEVFRDCVSKIISNHRYAPMIDDFRNNIQGYESPRKLRISTIKEKHYCNYCDNTGSISNGKTMRCCCELGEPGLCLPDYIIRYNPNVHRDEKKYRTATERETANFHLVKNKKYQYFKDYVIEYVKVKYNENAKRLPIYLRYMNNASEWLAKNNYDMDKLEAGGK